MKSCCSLLALALASVAPHAASAQPSPLVLGDLHREVVRASPRAAAARALARAAEARVPGAKLPPDPQLQLGFMNYSLPSLAPMDPLGMTQLQLMQMLPLGGKLGLSGRVAEAQHAAQRARAADVEWEVRSQVAMAFYDLYQADQGLVVARETIRLLQDARATAEAMYRVGEGRQADVLRAQVEIARMTEDTLRMRAMRSTMVARLDALLDRAQGADVGAPALPQFPAEVPSLDSLDALARANRPMLAAGEQALQAAQAGEQLMRREIWPDLQLGVAYGQRAASDGMG
ncbi:MAG: TolC family protein, partial [Gemmatimonadaceae bacterium]